MFREANLDDLKSLVNLGQILTKHEKTCDPYLKGISEKESFNHYNSELSNSYSKFYVFEDKGKIVAYIYGFIKDAPSHIKVHKKIGYLEACVVKDEYRGKKISKKLTEQLLAWFKLKGVNLVELGVYANNDSISVWQKLGFKHHHVTMRKEI